MYKDSYGDIHLSGNLRDTPSRSYNNEKEYREVDMSLFFLLFFLILWILVFYFIFK